MGGAVHRIICRPLLSMPRVVLMHRLHRVGPPCTAVAVNVAVSRERSSSSAGSLRQKTERCEDGRDWRHGPRSRSRRWPPARAEARAENLGRNQPRRARYLWMTMSKAGYRTREPAEADIAPELPHRLKDTGRHPHTAARILRSGLGAPCGADPGTPVQPVPPVVAMAARRRGPTGGRCPGYAAGDQYRRGLGRALGGAPPEADVSPAPGASSEADPREPWRAARPPSGKAR